MTVSVLVTVISEINYNYKNLRDHWRQMSLSKEENEIIDLEKDVYG